MDSRKERILQDWKASRNGRQLELVFWRPPYFLDRRAKAYQRGINGIEQAQTISANA